MANVTVSGYLNCSDGTQLNLEATITEGTETDLTMNTDYSITGSQVGDYYPGGHVISGLIQPTNGIAYAYLLRQGVVEAIIPIGKKGISPVAMPLCGNGFVLQAGDIIRVMVNTAADREAAVSVYTNRGVSRIFSVTPSGAANNQPVDIQTGNSVGDTLQGQVITKAFCTSVDGNKIDGGGCLMLNEKGMPVGQPINCNTPAESPIYFQSVSIPCALNFEFRITTSS
jgi:hypothetical protein